MLKKIVRRRIVYIVILLLIIILSNYFKYENRTHKEIRDSMGVEELLMTDFLPPRNKTCFPEPIRARKELGNLADFCQFRVGVELGVQQGVFSKQVLDQWKSNQQYILVDVWAQQSSTYIDPANVGDAKQRSYFAQTLTRLQEYRNNLRTCVGTTLSCADRVRPYSVDFIYVDARHDYQSVYEDLTTWWPKLVPGGLMSGHDFIDYQGEGMALYFSGNDWRVNADGSYDHSGRVCRGAVIDFFRERNIHVHVTYRDWDSFSWYVFKPIP